MFPPRLNNDGLISRYTASVQRLWLIFAAVAAWAMLSAMGNERQRLIESKPVPVDPPAAGPTPVDAPAQS